MSDNKSFIDYSNELDGHIIDIERAAHALMVIRYGFLEEHDDFGSFSNRIIDDVLCFIEDVLLKNSKEMQELSGNLCDCYREELKIAQEAHHE